MNARVQFITAAALVPALAMAAGAACRSRPRVPVVRVVRQPLVQSLVVSGRVRAPVRVSIGALSLAAVRQRLVEEGHHVTAGQELLRLDAAEATAAVRQARAAVGQVDARLAQLRTVNSTVVSADLAQARAGMDRADRELARLEALATSGLVTASQLDDARKSAAVARSQHDAARAQFDGAKPAGVEDRAAAAAVEQARAALAAAETRLAQLTIRAPASGVVIGRDVEAGDIVQPGQTLMQLAVDGPVELTIDPDEKNLAAIALGQAALASADAFPAQSFPATVNFIGPAVDAQRGTVEVRLSVPSPPAFLRPDMTVSVELKGVRREQVLVVPSEAVRDVTGRAPWVLAITDGVVERRSVRIGLRGDTLTEVLGGLAEGDLVVPASAGAPGLGTRVTPREAGK